MTSTSKATTTIIKNWEHIFIEHFPFTLDPAISSPLLLHSVEFYLFYEPECLCFTPCLSICSQEPRGRKDSARDSASDAEMGIRPGPMDSPSLKRKTIASRNEDPEASSRRRKNSSVYDSSGSDRENGEVKTKRRERRASGIENCAVENRASNVSLNSIKNSPR